jgi:hypothetical protein
LPDKINPPSGEAPSLGLPAKLCRFVKPVPSVGKQGSGTYPKRHCKAAPRGCCTSPDANVRVAAWHAAAPEIREQMAARRPLLRAMARQPNLERLGLERLILIERLIWERVNERAQATFGWFCSIWAFFRIPSLASFPSVKCLLRSFPSSVTSVASCSNLTSIN